VAFDERDTGSGKCQQGMEKAAITRVPPNFTDKSIKEDSGAVMIRRITKATEGKVVATSWRTKTHSEGDLHQPTSFQRL